MLSECHIETQYAECHFAKYHNAYFHYFECHFAKCHNAYFHDYECHLLNAVVLIVVILSVLVHII
jgi:hypothetical protein